MEFEQTKHINIAYLYHPEDESHLNLLRDHLVGLHRKELVKEWYETLAGDAYQDQTQFHLEKAQVIVLLVSHTFNAEERYNSPEMVSLIKNCSEKGACIWPIIAKPVYWEMSEYREYEVFFGKDKSIASYNPQGEAFKLIAEKINWEVAFMLSEAWVCDGNEFLHNMLLDKALFAYERSLHYQPQNFSALLGKGRVLRKLDKVEEANGCFESIIHNSQEVPQRKKDTTYSKNQKNILKYICCRSAALLELGRYSEAIKAFQSVCQQFIPPIDDIQRDLCAEAYCGEGDAYLKLGDQVSPSLDYYGQALRAYNQAKNLIPDHPVYTTKVADVYTASGMKQTNPMQADFLYKKALDIYTQTGLLHPDFAPAHVGRGHALSKLRCSQEALVAYNTAIKFNPFDAATHAGRGYVLLKNNPQEALSAFEEAIRLEKNNGLYYYGKGQAQAKIGFYQNALNAYAIASDYGFQSADLLVDRADAFLKLGDAKYRCGQRTQGYSYYKDAYASYHCALSCQRHEKDRIYYGLGRIAFANNDWEDAFTCYLKAIEFAPYKSDAYLEIGKIYIQLERDTDAFSYFKCARERCNHPDSMISEADVEIAQGDAYFHIAKKYESMEYYTEQEKAQKSYKKALDIRKDVMAYVGLGKTCTELSAYTEAINAFGEALKLNPHLSECYFLWGRCHYELGQPRKAYTLYGQAIAYGFDGSSIRNAQADALLALKEKYFEAIKIFDDVIGHEKSDMEEVAHAFCGKGIAFHAVGIIEDALKSFMEARKINPSICSQSRYRRIIEDIGIAIEGNIHRGFEDISAYKNKGDILLLLGEKRAEEAVNLYTKAIKYGDESADVYYCRGEAYFLAGQYRKSLKDYRKALDIDPNYRYAQQGLEAVDATGRGGFWGW